MKKISFVTFGCKVNQYDTNVIMQSLPPTEFEQVPFEDKADYYVINTCTVTHRADSEARNYINRAKRANPGGVVIVTGCYAQVSSEELRELEGVDYVVGNSDKLKLGELIQKATKQIDPRVFVSDVFKRRDFESPSIDNFEGRTRAFLKVQDGCDYRCTFCIIPYARGRSRSLSPREVVERMRILSHSGYKEAVLTGIHLSSYGRDIGTNLIELLGLIESEAPLGRVRLSSLDTADISAELIDLVASSTILCPSFHIALQSGDGDILKKMRRRYKPEKFLHYTDMIRDKMPDAAIGTDIMVGFPGEGDREFENTYEVLRRSALTYFHVFPYSIRKGAPAASMDDKVAPEVKKHRSRVLRTLGAEKKNEFYRSFIGKSLSVIIEKGSKGTSPNYIDVRIKSAEVNVGDEVEVRITDIVGAEALGVINTHQV